MNRRQPLRRTGIARGTAPLRRDASLARGDQPLPVRSKKRQKQMRERGRMLDALTAGEQVLCEVPGCSRWADDPHEPLTRARGGSITGPSNVRLICRPHHDEIGQEPPWAYALGFLRHSWDVA